MIDINYLKQLLEIFDESSVNDLRIEQGDGISIKLSKSPTRKDGEFSTMSNFQFAPMPLPGQSPSLPTAGSHPPVPTPATEAAKPVEAESARKYHEIRSPIVGTFYRAASPDTPPFVEVGQAVSPGMVLCIIEAMKLMNEIECDTYGKIAKVLVENAQPVEYNQVLFLVEPE
jgi:acetyl-CoA carboxylase biotin carboxyl carrier protein